MITDNSETVLFLSWSCLGYTCFIYHQHHCDRFFSHWFFLWNTEKDVFRLRTNYSCLTLLNWKYASKHHLSEYEVLDFLASPFITLYVANKFNLCYFSHLTVTWFSLTPHFVTLEEYLGEQLKFSIKIV